jgi:dynein heavy chain
MKDIWKDSDQRTPIIFVLSPGADPTASLLKFKSELNKNGANIDLEIISLGQGQGGPAQ